MALISLKGRRVAALLVGSIATDKDACTEDWEGTAGPANINRGIRTHSATGASCSHTCQDEASAPEDKQIKALGHH